MTMESVDQLSRQLQSLDELRTIVRTMKALSAASIRQYEQAVAALAGYYRTVERGLHIALAETEMPTAPKSSIPSAGRRAAIVFGSDHGLCGRFNEEIAAHALAQMARPDMAGDPVMVTVGARVAASIERQGRAIEEEFIVPGSASQITATVQQILLKVDEWREQSGVDTVHLFYNRHAGGKGYQPTRFALLPIDLRRFHSIRQEPWPSRSLPTFTMNRERLIGRLLRQFLFVSTFRACAESQASEHAARLAAMQSAERSLDDRLDEVTMGFRRARQDAITAELLDVVSGYEAVRTLDEWS